MEPGKQDSRIREQLDTLDQVPDNFRFRQALVWEQVEARLDEKKRRPVGWLYGAAAAVLLLFAGWWWLNNKKAAPPVSEKKMPVSNQSSTAPGRDTTQKIILPETPVQQQQSASIAVKRPGAAHTATGNPMRQDSMVVDLISANKAMAVTDSNNQQLTAMPLAVDSLLATKSVRKPRFGIAHINELDNNRNDAITAQQVMKKKPLLTSFRFSPKNATNDVILNENMLFVGTPPRSFLKSVQITKE